MCHLARNFQHLPLLIGVAGDHLSALTGHCVLDAAAGGGFAVDVNRGDAERPEGEAESLPKWGHHEVKGVGDWDKAGIVTRTPQAAA